MTHSLQWTVPPWIADLPQVSDFAEIDEILRSDAFRQGSHQKSRPFFGDSLLVLDGAEHRARRRLEARLFTKAALEHYEREALIPVIRRAMAENEGTPTPAGVRIDLVPLVRTMLHRIAARVTGIDGVDTSAGVTRFRELVARLGEGASVEWSVRDHDEVIREGLAYRQEFLDEFLLPSEARRAELVRRFRAGEIGREDLPTDLLTLLHLHRDPAWDPELPWRETAFYLVAAIQTTTIALPHVVMHLHEWVACHPGDAPRTADPEFLRLAAVETLRLHQPAPTLLRFATRDVTLSSGRRFHEGERIVLMFVPANRDTALFGPDAEEFNPFREPPDRRRPWGLTFGAGSHICLGRTLVTGLSSRVDDDSGTDGTMVTLLAALYGAGITLVPDDMPQKTESSFHDSYAMFPVLFTRM